MHQQAWARIDLHHGTVDLLQRARDIGCDQIDAGNIKTYNLGRQNRHVGDLGMNFIGDIIGHIAGTLNDDDFSLFRNAVYFKALFLDFQNDVALLGENDFFQWEFFFQAATWI